MVKFTDDDYDQALNDIHDVAMAGISQARKRGQKELVEKFELIISITRFKMVPVTDADLKDD